MRGSRYTKDRKAEEQKKAYDKAMAETKANQKAAEPPIDEKAARGQS